MAIIACTHGYHIMDGWLLLLVRMAIILWTDGYHYLYTWLSYYGQMAINYVHMTVL